MELSHDLSAEKLPTLIPGEHSGDVSRSEVKAMMESNMSDEELLAQVEMLLLDRVKAGEKLALFQLAQLYFEQANYEDATKYYNRSVERGDYQAMFQLGVILYDGLAGPPDHARGFELMQRVANATSKRAAHLVRAAQYNLGRAYFQGYGVRRSEEDAERLWLLAADDGNPKASVKAQTTLGMFYSRPETQNLNKAFFWHSEACGNGSLESQGALGVMYLHGIGTKQNDNSSFECLREAAERGNVYAMGNLVAHYYRRKLYTKTVELAARISALEAVDEIAEETDCIPRYIRKGIALGCFYYARCLHQGIGVLKDDAEAKRLYSRSFRFDPDTCATLQDVTTHGQI